jgi:hypothetical protein
LYSTPQQVLLLLLLLLLLHLYTPQEARHVHRAAAHWPQVMHHSLDGLVDKGLDGR